jgi:quinoprotein glucose dehydrogenase
MRKVIPGMAAVVTSFMLAAATPSAQQVAPGDWPHFNRDAGSSRYVPLDQINATNVTRLQPAWTFAAVTEPPPGAGPGPAGRAGGAGRGGRGAGGGVGAQVVPVVVNGVMYVPAGNVVVAIDGATGKEVWRYTVTTGAASNRGVNYWAGNGTVGPRIVFTTRGQSGNSLVALDAATGKPSAGFGQNGITDLGSVGWSGVPVVFRNVLALGASTLETPQDPNTPGDTRGFDAITGKLKWTFHSVPRPGEAGHETWLNDGWKDRSGTNIWNHHMTADEQLGLLYLPISGPASNYYGGDRPGDNLFGNSIVAIDGNTGAYKWHFSWCTTTSGISTTRPRRRCSRSRATASGSRRSRRLASRAGCSSSTAGTASRSSAWTSARRQRRCARRVVRAHAAVSAQAERAGAYELQLRGPGDGRGHDAGHAANCRRSTRRAAGSTTRARSRRSSTTRRARRPRSSIIFPGATGGTNWGGHGHGPAARLRVRLHAEPGADRLGGEEEAGRELRLRRGAVEPAVHARERERAGAVLHLLRVGRRGARQLSVPAAAVGQLNAVDANTGDILWQVPVGIAERLPAGKQNTGLSGGFAGPTATAGGLVFYAALSDRRLRAFDSMTGKELWSVDLGATATMQPMSYLGSDRRQYVAVVAGGTVKTFAMPR